MQTMVLCCTDTNLFQFFGDGSVRSVLEESQNDQKQMQKYMLGIETNLLALENARSMRESEDEGSCLN